MDKDVIQFAFEAREINLSIEATSLINEAAAISEL
jgi:hypothetical protein